MPLPLAIPPAALGFEMLMALQGTSQGLQQTDGLQVFPRAYLAFGTTQVGVQWRNVSSPSATGVAAVFVRRTGKVGALRLDLAARYRIKTGSSGGQDRSAWEFSGGARRAFGRLELSASAEGSLNDFGSGPSAFVELSPAWRAGRTVSISASLGHRFRDGAPDYTALNLGVSKSFDPHLGVDLRYYVTDRGELGERYRSRLAVSARLAL